MSYAKIILDIDPTANARGIEAYMRSEHGTLDHLPREVFVKEIKMAAACDRQCPGFLDLLASTY